MQGGGGGGGGGYGTRFVAMKPGSGPSCEDRKRQLAQPASHIGSALPATIARHLGPPLSQRGSRWSAPITDDLGRGQICFANRPHVPVVFQTTRQHSLDG